MKINDKNNVDVKEAVPVLLEFASTEEEFKQKYDKGQIFRLSDRFIKYLFGRKERKGTLLSFINSAVFPDGERSFIDLSYSDREFPPQFDDGKECRLDIVAAMDDGTLVNLEVQVRSRNDYTERSVYYLTMLHSSQLERGESYIAVRPTISLHILGFDLFEGDNCRSSFSLRNDETGEKLNDDLTLVFAEVWKFIKKGSEPRNGLERWMMYFSGLEESKMPEAMTADSAIKEALNAERYFAMDKNERLAYFTTYKALMDAANNDATIRHFALEEGRYQEKLDTARKLIALNMDVNQISIITTLSAMDIEKLR